MTDFNARPFRRYGGAAVAAAASLFVGAAIIVWTWNTIAVDFFAAPVIDFRQAVAGELAVAVFAAIAGLGIRIASGSRRHGGAVS